MNTNRPQGLHLVPLLSASILAACATAEPTPIPPAPTEPAAPTTVSEATGVPTVIGAITAPPPGGAAETALAAGQDVIGFDTDIIDLQSPGCGADGCAKLHLEFPQITGGLSPADQERLNKQIRDQVALLAFQDQEQPLEGSLTQQAQAWLDWAAAAAEESGSTGPWTKELKATVLHHEQGYLSLEFPVYSFTGGAHPNSQTKIVSLARPSLQPLTLQDVLVDEAAMGALTAAGEKALRAERQIPADRPLSEAGFTFPDDRFALNENFALTAAGLRFHYDAYEVGPYALGPTTIDIPWSELSELTRYGNAIP